MTLSQAGIRSWLGENALSLCLAFPILWGMPQNSDFKFLAVTALVVTLLGVQTFRDTFGDDLSEGGAPVLQSSRAPASVAPTALTPAKSASSSEALLMDWDLNCGGDLSKETQVTSSYLRLRGKACGEVQLQSGKVTLTNETNGFTASIFAKGKTAYETDLIQLREGANLIRLHYVTSGGRKVETVLTVISKASLL